jgi:hypothetical protein
VTEKGRENQKIHSALNCSGGESVAAIVKPEIKIQKLYNLSVQNI